MWERERERERESFSFSKALGFFFQELNYAIN